MKWFIYCTVLFVLFFPANIFSQFGPPIDTVNVVNGWRFVGSEGGNAYDTAYTRMDTLAYHGKRFAQLGSGNDIIINSNYSQLFVYSIKDINTKLVFEKTLDKGYKNQRFINVWIRIERANRIFIGGDPVISFFFGDGNIWVSAGSRYSADRSVTGAWMEVQVELVNPPTDFITNRLKLVFGFSFGSYGNAAFRFDDYSLIADKTIFDVPNIMFDSVSVVDSFENVSILKPDKDTLLMSMTSPSDVVSITNNGNSDMFISHMELTNVLFSASPDTLTIPAGESRDISTTFDFANVVGIINAKLIIYSNSMTSPDTLTLKGDATTGIERIDNSIPKSFVLSQNYPNPFNPSTRIRFSVAEQSFVTLKVYDLLGREVVMLVNGEKPVGSYEATFDASNLPSGVYIYRLQAGDFTQTKKMVLMK